MTRNRWLLILAGLIAGVVASGRLVSLAQDSEPAGRKDAQDPAKLSAPAEDRRLPELNAADARATPDAQMREAAGPGSSLQVALLRPYHFTFARPTPLFQVCAQLKQTLKAEVVLDLAALGRQDVEPEDPVQLELEGVRLKTGLKLLLDQVGLIYRVVSEDNLMIITDLEGADDPEDRILAELKALHRDLHALQDDVDELRELVGDDRQGGRVRKPTIIEEMPDVEGERPAAAPEKPGNNTRPKPEADSPAAGARPATGAPGTSEGSAARTASRRDQTEGDRRIDRADLTQVQDVNQPGRERQAKSRPEILSRGESQGRNWLREPKTAVWIILLAAIALGGWRKLRLAWRARKAVARLEDPRVTPAEVEAAAEHGRAAVWELLRIFSSSTSEPLRQAAGRALARLWFLDQLVAEEEQAIVRRGFTVTWHARRRYPRALRAEIPIAVNFEVPFLDGEAGRVRPGNLEWSHRVLGTRRATLEEVSPWAAGRGRASFTLVPGDFETNGPHRLVLQARVRTAGLTDSWEFELPHVPFNLEFDPFLQLDAIATLPDSIRDAQVEQSIRLEPGDARDGEPATFLTLGTQWTIRNPPRLALATPLPCDLAHAISVEFEGIAQTFSAGTLILSGQGLAHPSPSDSAGAIERIPLREIKLFDSSAIERAGQMRVRVALEPMPESGWSDPAIRSIWPGKTRTNWVEVEIVRR